MKNLFFLYCLFFVGLSTFKAQHPTTPESRKNLQLYINSESLLVQNSSADLSQYFGYDNKIKEVTISNNIPQNFPTKEGYVSKAAYLTVANEWLKAHSALVKPEFTNILIKD